LPPFCCSGILAVVGIRNMGKINDQSTDIATNWMPSIDRTNRMNTATSDLRVAELTHVATSDDAMMAKADKDILDIMKYFEEQRSAYVKLISSPEERAIYERFATSSSVTWPFTRAFWNCRARTRTRRPWMPSWAAPTSTTAIRRPAQAG
jgi:hypothetical protein